MRGRKIPKSLKQKKKKKRKEKKRNKNFPMVQPNNLVPAMDFGPKA